MGLAARLLPLIGLAAVQTGCDYLSDQVKVGTAKGVLRGWDHSKCECEFDSSVAEDPVVSFTCSPLFDGKDGYSGFLYLWTTPINEATRTGVWSYDGINGTAVMEITSETDTLHDESYRAVFIDTLDIPAQDACLTGYGDYYAYEDCEPFAGGTLENVRLWCKEDTGGYY